MDIMEPMETLRVMLQDQLGISLEQHQFWLRDLTPVSEDLTPISGDLAPLRVNLTPLSGNLSPLVLAVWHSG